MEGSFVGENKLLIFAPPLWETALVAGCLLGGPVIYLAWMLNIELPYIPSLPWLGPAVFLAGVWALVSAERLVCFLREGTYVRKEGSGLRLTRGRLAEFDALEVMAEDITLMRGFATGQAVVYRIVLHWKGGIHPPLVVQREERRISSISHLPQGGWHLVERASIYGRAMGIPVYNNTAQFSKGPLSPL